MNRYTEAAWLAVNGGKFPSHVDWLYKELTNVETIKTTEPPDLSNYYTTVYEDKVTSGSNKTMNGEWIDNVIFEYWMVSAIQRNIFNLLKSSTKIPATNKGVGQVLLKLQEVLDFSVKENGINDYTILDTTINRTTRTLETSFKFSQGQSINVVDKIYGLLIN